MPQSQHDCCSAKMCQHVGLALVKLTESDLRVPVDLAWVSAGPRDRFIAPAQSGGP